MPPKGEKGPKNKTGKERPSTLENFSIAVALLETDAAILKERGVLEEYELERRYLPSRTLTQEELAKLEKRNIIQKFVTLKDTHGNDITFRLRITEGKEGILYRIARKERTGDLFGKQEHQIYFKPDPNDPRTKEFEKLWDGRTSRAITRDRYYLSHPLPNGSSCEIHYELWKGGPEDGFVRIEVEFKNDEDELFYEKNGAKKLLPDWIGKDVTDDSEYRAKNITADGLPKGAIEHMKKLSKKK